MLFTCTMYSYSCLAIIFPNLIFFVRVVETRQIFLWRQFERLLWRWNRLFDRIRTQHSNDCDISLLKQTWDEWSLCNKPRQVFKNNAVPPTDSKRFSMQGNVSPIYVCIENIAARIFRSILNEILSDMHWSAKITTRRSYFGDKCRSQNDWVTLIALTFWQVLF